jgi:regulatory protein
LRWLARREHSRTELARKLKSKGFDEAEIADTLSGLEESGWQNDRRFLESLVRSEFAKGRGVQWIRQQAYLKGLESEELEECLREYDWAESLEKVHRKKFGGAPPATPKEYAARARYLSQRGFEQESIQALLRRLSRGGDEF